MKVSCRYCNKSLPKSAPRVTVKGCLVCEDCAYLIEYPNAKRIEELPKVNPKRPQVEELFS